MNRQLFWCLWLNYSHPPYFKVPKFQGTHIFRNFKVLTSSLFQGAEVLLQARLWRQHVWLRGQPQPSELLLGGLLREVQGLGGTVRTHHRGSGDCHIPPHGELGTPKRNYYFFSVTLFLGKNKHLKLHKFESWLFSFVDVVFKEVILNRCVLCSALLIVNAIAIKSIHMLLRDY